jgi:PTH1 family peptidyl-tRNA hydrolase
MSTTPTNVVSLVVGLGNPGPKYARHRHNVGFMALELFGEKHGADTFRDKFHGRFTKCRVGSAEVVLLEPLTFMNLSGRSVQAAMQFFKIDRAGICVVHDELDVPFGELRVKLGGGTAGHNGLGSIVEHCGGQDFARLRVGIGRPQGNTPVERHVLSEFSSIESQELPAVLERASAALADCVSKGPAAAMNLHNQRPKAPTPS